MKTLAYFASGDVRKEYNNLDFDKIYLIDKCFNKGTNGRIISKGKITCIGMDCLESIKFLAKENVKIDYFVSLNEGLWEGGGSYAINSDIFLGYAMTLLNNCYIHIMNMSYYGTREYHVSMDIPYDMIEIKEDDDRYLNPSIFSDYDFAVNGAKVLQMSKLISKNHEISINQNTIIKIIHDSIWNYYEYLETIAISFSQQDQLDFFDKIPKVLNLNKMQTDDVFNYCESHKIEKIGFTPWGKGNYKNFINKLKERESDYPREISLFHLNKNDYQEFKKWGKQ